MEAYKAYETYYPKTVELAHLGSQSKFEPRLSELRARAPNYSALLPAVTLGIWFNYTNNS